MALVGVEPVKIQLSQLDLRAVQHSEAHADKDVLDLIQCDIHGVAVAQAHGLSRDGHIHLLIGQTAL